MIKRVSGVLERVEPSGVELLMGHAVHEVLVPELVRRGLQQKLGQTVTLHTLEFLEGNPTRGNMVPRLVGFLTEVEREFFELICEVDGVGVRKALRAIVRPVGEIATAIEEQDWSLSIPLYVTRPAGSRVGSDSTAETESLTDAWMRWKTDGEDFWRQMDGVTAMLDGLAAQEKHDG